MKVALLGDTHIGARNDNPAFHKLFAKFYDNVFFPYLEQHNILHVIQLGDVFDRRKYINFNSLQLGKQYFFDRLNQNYTSWVLVGNHDSYYKNTIDVNSPSLLFKGYNNINCVEKPTEIELEGVKMMMIPWWCEENDTSIREALESTNATHVIGHFEIDGFEMYTGMPHQGGLTRKAFSKFETVWTGHFHHQSKQGNIHYLGTPYEMTWSDFGDQKGFHVFDTETRELTFVPNPHTIFKKVHYDDSSQLIDNVLGIDFSQYNETFVKLIVRNKTNPYWFDMFVDKLEKAGVYSVQVVDDHFHMDTEADVDITSEAEDTLTILTKYVHQVDAGVDKTQLASVMMNLYNEALRVEIGRAHV